MNELYELIEKVSLLTGLYIAITDDKWLTVYKDGRKIRFLSFESDEALKTVLWEYVYRHARQQVALARVCQAVAEGKPWADLFSIAVDDFGWDPQELADLSNVPQATNIELVDLPEPEEEGVDSYW